jgi:hypothetical protein
MLVRLLYASYAAESLTCEAVNSILATSRTHNTLTGITGLLCYSDKLFIQVLEGGRHEVSTLYNRIARDPRHQQVELLHFEEITERRFADWTMGRVNLTKVNPSLLLKYAESPTLDPGTMSGAQLLALLNELIATAAVMGRS